ncbi:hypothetical protein NKH34_19425 [Mesorhizobium sp. M1148]|uniref:hypothetical protein n=1 Tax=unclassified Mesorhizobium TaxID=325217 RepID=UPI0012EB5D73|nr:MULTISPECIES: hypothetical protein [unclassified Mesorhizobium]WJI55982.1 hypothetical protein NLY33_22685 [Mesorhizobium sp. C432A]
MWRSNLNSIGPRGIFPGAANTVASSSISTSRYVSGLRFCANFVTVAQSRAFAGGRGAIAAQWSDEAFVDPGLQQPVLTFST